MMVIDYEGAPVHECIFEGFYYIIESVKNDIVTIKRQCSVIGTQNINQIKKITFEKLKKENDHIMMILKKGDL
jgi:hypothetical protein